MIDAAGIAAVLPHRAPMLLVDEVTGLADGEWLTSRRAVGADEPWFAVAGADPTDPDAAFPQPLTLESWAQSAGILATKDSPNPDVLAGSVMLFGGASAVEYHRPVRPGDVLEHRVRFSRVMADSVVADGETLVDGEPVMTVGQIIMMFRPASVLRPSEETEGNSR